MGWPDAYRRLTVIGHCACGNVIGAVGALARVGGDTDIQQGMVAAAAAPGPEPPFPPTRQDYIDG